MATVEVERKGHLFRRFGEGFHQCWYPVGLSADVEAGQHFGTDFCDGRIVVYRGEDGVAHAVTPYCAHMGSDLTVGCVVGNNLRCAFHHWEYGPDGRCTVIPTGDRIPRAARLFSFPTEERYGIIWVFFGETPLYDLPSFPSWVTDRPMIWRAFETQFDQPLMVEPWVFTTNMFDFMHLEVVHGVKDMNPEIEVHGQVMQWTADVPHPVLGKTRVTAQCWGTNSAMQFGERDGHIIAGYGALTWMGSERGTRHFGVAGAELRGDDDAARAQAEEAIDNQQQRSNVLINEDIPIMNTLRLGDDHLVGYDRKLAAYLRYARDYPRTTMASLEGQS